MYPVLQNKPKVCIRDENGVVIISDHQDEALDLLRVHYHPHINDSLLCNHWIEFEIQEYNPRSKSCIGPIHKYVLRVIHTWSGLVKALVIPRDRTREIRRIYIERNFRKKPVPRTGRRKHSCNFRDPKTYAELKAFNGFLEDEEYHKYKIRIRIKRKYIPTERTDIYVPYYKSWKKYRQTQWKFKS